MKKTETSSSRRDWKTGAAVAALVFAALLAVVAGWKIFYFWTDDAYIAFRYVSNSMEGYGFVWNPPPFRPVEGYTSFLWVAMLRAVWWLTGLAPPRVANGLSLFFGIATLFIVYRFIREMVLPGMPAGLRIASGAVVLAGIIGNRTFLAWLSSGLEASLYNFLLTAWLYLVFSATRASGEGRLKELPLALCAALLYLCRPEGALAAVGTVVVHILWNKDAPPAARTRIWKLAPLMAIPVHLAWRRVFYGYWLPNTYYAKVVGAWPQSGWRYLASFIIEYSVWVWIVIVLLFLARRAAAQTPPGQGPSTARAIRLVALGVLIIQLTYYTFIVGGDHFEYRVYSYVIPLLFLSALSLLSRTLARPRMVPAVLLLFVLASLPIPWTHWHLTRNLTTREGTSMMVKPVSGSFPALVRPLVALWDRQQAWLIRHLVCARHQEHKIAFRYLASILPSRDGGRRIGWEERAVLPEDAVGLLGWVLPEVAILDRMGLNDLVIARTPPPARRIGARLMAHDRWPPPGYEACFAPNVSLSWDAGELVVKVERRAEPLTDERIIRCESKYLEMVSER